jgi:OOP family OmpA-OmpF porin
LKDKLVKQYGISANRISVDAKGDTVQPFSENTKNRVSIVTGTTKK